MNTPLTVHAINALEREAFVAALGWVVEGSPWVAQAAWQARPFRDRAALHAAMVDALVAAPDDRQLAVVRAHPDLAGRAAIAGDLTAESIREQASAGLDRLTPHQYAEFNRLNQAYARRFGFPFVICVREHDQASILRSFSMRLQNDAATELRTAVAEVGKIVVLRLADAVA